MTRSHFARFAVIALIFIGIQSCVAMIGWAALKAINATRSYATGESLYSKGQKSAVFSLYKYAESGSEKDYEDYLVFIRVPLGDRMARQAMDTDHPDPAAAAAGLRQSQTNADDIPSVIRVFSLMRNWGPFAQAVEDWRQADRLTEKLIAVADRFHERQKGGAVTPRERRQFLADLDAANTEFDNLGHRFSDDIGDAARSAMRLVSSGLATCISALWIAGLWLAWRTYWKGAQRDVQLRESDRRFRDFAETASDWFWQMDAENKLTYLSERFAEALDMRPQDLAGKTFADIGLELFGLDAKIEFAAIAERVPFRSVSLRYASQPSREQYWMISGVPVFSDDGSFIGYRGTGSNVTKEMLAKHALEDAKAQSELASRAKTEFLATMSHELRTPLNAIIGFSEIIKDRLFGSAIDRYAEYAADIFASAQHLLAIINDILDMSKIEAGQMELHEENIVLSELVESVVRLLSQKIDAAQISLATDTDNLPLIRADQRKLKQILMNLLSNAVKFTPPGGKVDILSFFKPNGDLGIEVKDTGIGMAAEEIPTALSAFGQVDSTLSRKHEGTGLGLPLVKSLVEIHGGQFVLTSEPGHGTSAVVILPKARVLRMAA